MTETQHPYRDGCSHCAELSETIQKQSEKIKKLKKDQFNKLLSTISVILGIVLGIVLVGFGGYKFVHWLNEPTKPKLTKVLVKGSTGFFIECNTTNDTECNRCYYKEAGRLCPHGYKWLKGDKYNRWDLIQCNGKKK